YSLTVIIASLFHISALPSIVLYFLVNTTFTRWYKKLYLPLLIIVFIFGQRTVQFLLLYFRNSRRILDLFSIGNDDLVIILIFLLSIFSYYLIPSLKEDRLFKILLVTSS